MQAKVTKDNGTPVDPDNGTPVDPDNGTPVDPDNAVAPVNKWLHSLCSQVDVYLNGTFVTPSSNTHPYRAYIETLLRYGSEAKETQLTSQLWYKDTAGRMDAVKIVDDDVTIRGLVSRRAHVTRSRIVEMIGYTWICSYKIVSIPHSHRSHVARDPRRPAERSGVVLYNGSYAKKVWCCAVQRFVREEGLVLCCTTVRTRRRSGVVLYNGSYAKKVWCCAVQRFVREEGLVLCCTTVRTRRRSGVVLYNGSYAKKVWCCAVQRFVREEAVSRQVQRRQLPRRLRGRSTDTLQTSPAEFRRELIHQKLPQPVHLDWQGVTGQGVTRQGVTARKQLTRDDFRDGYTWFGFDLPPYACDGSCFHQVQKGNLCIEMHFAAALQQTINVVVYAEFESELEIYKSRNVI